VFKYKWVASVWLEIAAMAAVMFMAGLLFGLAILLFWK
jgi:hypothetical protein